MSQEWDSKFEYLRNSRFLYHNDGYLEFLVAKVWKIEKPVKVVDFGCGYGFVGIKLLPLLPKGSTYTGIDSSEEPIINLRARRSQIRFSLRRSFPTLANRLFQLSHRRFVAVEGLNIVRAGRGQ